MDISDIEPRACYLDGMDGRKEALCYMAPASVTAAPGCIKEEGGGISIMVNRATIESRFAWDEKPTFYYS